MENSEKQKKKIPLFPKFKTTMTIRKHNANVMLSESSDDSDILQDSSDNEAEVEEDQRAYTMIAISKSKSNKNKPLNIDISKSHNNQNLNPDFKDIEDYVAQNQNIYDKKIPNKINEDKNKKKEVKSPDKKNNKKENNKILDDIFINNEGDIELKEKNKKDIKNKQKLSKNNQKVIKYLGPLMEEDENNGDIFINQNKSIFNSKKELWKFQKILLDNHIFDIIFDIKSKKNNFNLYLF